MNLDVSLWLVPIPEQEKQIQTTIDTLAKKYHAFPFIPHLTIYHFDTVSDVSRITDFK